MEKKTIEKFRKCKVTKKVQQMFLLLIQCFKKYKIEAGTLAWKFCILPAFLVLFGLSACCSDTGDDMDKLVSIGTHSLHIRCIGKGSPTVVIDTGVGDTLERWQGFQTRVAEFRCVCTYDRAGYGLSEPGPLPRTSQRAAYELELLLKKAHVKGPYVLVGHSLGGLNMQVFADRYPDLVAGLILLDPAPLPFITGQAYPDLFRMLEQQTADLQNTVEAMRQSSDAEAQAKANYLEAVASENAALIAESASQVAAIDSFGDIPLIVIGSGKPNPAFGADAEAFQQFWIEQDLKLVIKSTNGKFGLVPESSHYLHEDAPEVVLDAIRKIGEPEGNEYLSIFEEVWQTVNDSYFDPTFGGLDWKEVHDRYQRYIAAANDDKTFYALTNQMLFELNVSHIGIIPPEEKEQLEPVLSAEGSIGIDIRLVDGEAVITSVLPGSPGEQAGLRPGLIIQNLNGKTVEQWASEVWHIPPYHERNDRKRLTSKLQEQVYGPLNTTVSLVYLDVNGAAQEVALQRVQRSGRIDLGDVFPPFYVEFESKRLEEGIGYIRFNAFLPPIDQRFPEALESIHDVYGLIIDLRGNHGGVFPVRKALAEQLVQKRGLFWSYKGRDSVEEIYLEPVQNAYSGPLVVLIDVMSASSAEEFSGALQAIGRAVIVGERSAGICVVADVVQLSNGAILMYPAAQTRTANGTVLEGQGVIPDVEVILDRESLLQGKDPQLEAAIKAIQNWKSEGP
jgi:carboxyl-terminal processing protease